MHTYYITRIEAIMMIEIPYLSLQMCRAARIYGYFVPPKDWIPMVSQRLLAQASETDLMVLSHIIIGSDPQLLRGELEDLAMTLQDDSVALTLNVSFAQCGNFMILREIKFGDSRSAKSAILTHLEALNFYSYGY